MVASPITPPSTATILSPICTTVMKRPGCSCNFKTFSALILPSLANVCSLMRLAPAREISADDKIALTIINTIKIKIAADKLIMFSLLVLKCGQLTAGF